ncbi:hypothetical protein EYR36_003109 [Pleurotus pulmonarius]|nr:hypothetical protein EYR36_003109 [Pleurotus pulmonarius]KAF4582533.1 hypothetical protein EYR38_002659 [Pleurotus pulmonarius]
MFSNPFRAQPHTRRALSDQVRQEWRDFETWFKAQQSTMEKKCAEKFKEMDKDFHAKSSSSSAPTPAPASKKRMTAAQKQQQQKEQEAQKKAQLQKQKEEQRGHDESKNAVRLSLRKSLVLSGREEWQKRLGDKGLQDEDWVDMTDGEQQAVQRLLGGDFDEEEEEGDDEEDEDSSLLHAMTQTQIQSLLRQAPLPSTSGQQPVAGSSKLPTPQHPQPSPQSLQASLAALQTSVPPASSLPSASRSTNPASLSTPTASNNQPNNVGGSYAFVNPSSFGHPRVYEDDDDDDDNDGGSSPFEDLTFFSEVLKQPASNPFPSHPASSFHSESSSLSGWSTEFSLSSTATSTQTSHTGSPEQPAPKTIAADPMPGGWNFAGGKLDATPTQTTVAGKKSGWLSSQTAASSSAKQAGKQPQRSIDSSASASSSGSGPGAAGAPNTHNASSRSRVAGPPYIGPVLNTQEDYITYNASTTTHQPHNTHNTHNTPHGQNHNGNNSGGPVHVELTSEEADFENFKMDVRIRKIHEFHQEAAAADEALIRDIFRSRKLHKLGLYDDQIDIPGAGVGGGVGGGGGNGSGINGGGDARGEEDGTALLRRERERRCYEEENKKIVEHEKTMVHLRKLKEDERKEIVDDERRKRRNAIKRRSVVGPPHTQHHQELAGPSGSGHVKAASAPSAPSIAPALSKGASSSSSSMGFGSGTIRARPQSSAPISASMLFPPQLDSALSTSSTSSNASYAASAFFTPSSFTPSISAIPLASSASSMEDGGAGGEEMVFDEAKIASILAAQAQMAQKFDSWAPTAGGSSQSGSPRGAEEVLPPAPASVPAPPPPSSSSSLGEEKKSGNGKEKEKEKEGSANAKGAANGAANGSRAPAPAPVVPSEPETKPVVSNSKLSKAAKKKGKKGASAPEPPAAPAPAPAAAKAKASEKVDAKANGKGKESVVAAKVVEATTKDAGGAGGIGGVGGVGKVTVSKEALQQAPVPQPSAKSPWAKKEEPVAKSKSDVGGPAGSGSQQQQQQQASKVSAQKEPVAARWKFSLFDDDEPATATAGATSSRTTLDQAAAAALGGLKSNLLQPPTQGIWMPGGNAGMARATSDQPTGGLKAPDVAGVLRTVSDQSSAKPASASSQAQSHMASRPEIWLPPKAKQTTGSIAQPQPQPWDRKPMSAAARARRMSEPAPPSPVDPAFFADPSMANGARRAADAQGKSILKKGAKSSKKSGVMVEEVSDDEDTDGVGEALSTDSRYIIEENPNIVKPKPSVPSKMFDNIIAYDDEDYDSGSTVSGPSTVGGWDSLVGGMAESKSMKAKHVRWTPSALGNASPISFRGDEEGPGMNIEAFLQDAASALNQGKAGVPLGPVGGRGRTGSMSQGGGFKWGQANNRAGDVSGAPKQDSSDELSWYAMEAMKQMRSKPASAV